MIIEHWNEEDTKDLVKNVLGLVLGLLIVGAVLRRELKLPV